MYKKKKLVIAGVALVAIIIIVVALLIGNKKPMTYNVFFETDGGSSVKSQIPSLSQSIHLTTYSE